MAHRKLALCAVTLQPYYSIWENRRKASPLSSSNAHINPQVFPIPIDPHCPRVMPLSENLQKLTGAWSTDVLPTATTLTHINPTNVYGVIETLLSASSAYPTITKRIELYSLARAVKGAKASLSVISAQNYIATATATQDFPLMTQVIWNSTMELQDLEMGFNLYQMKLSRWPNVLFAAIFALLVLVHFGLSAWKRTAYFGFCLVAGTFLETAGYAARVLSIGHYSDKNRYICQTISLTLAPAFIMAGVYYLLAQLMVIHGRRFTLLRPLWYSYIFIFCDVCSLFIQAAGGGLAAISLQNLESTHVGTVIMTVGVAFQVGSMTLFLFFLINFLWRIYFSATPSVRFLFRNMGDLFFQTKRGKELQRDHLYPMYDQRFRETMDRPLFGAYPLAIFMACFFIYVRCTYRLIELSEGWSGYLITHEEYVMTLDALQVLFTCVILVFFHPGIVFGTSFRGSITGKMGYVNSSEDKEYPYTTNIEKLDDDSLSWDSDEYSLKGSVAGQQKTTPKQSYQGNFNVIPYFTTPKQDPVDNPFEDPWERRNSLNSQTHSGSNMIGALLENPFEPRSHVGSSEMHQKRSTPKLDNGALKPVIEDEIMAIPYNNCTENPPAISQTPKRKSKNLSKSFKKSDTASVLSVNPYEKEGVDVIKTSGPYELYERPELSSTYQVDNSDLESRLTYDEFFFNFGSKR